MKHPKRLTLKELSKIAGLDLDDTLLILWEAGIEGINDPSNELVGAKLLAAKRALSIPDSRELTSLLYWQRMLSATESDLRILLKDLGIPMSQRSRKLPKGGIKKLKSFILGKSPTTFLVDPPSESQHTESAHQVIEEAKEPLPFHHPPRQEVEWKTVGHKREVRLLDVDEVLGIHFAMVSDFQNHSDPITPAGPRNDNIINSAVFRQHTSIGGELKYPTVEMSAAALVHSLVHDHPFHNGNKRTALVSMLVLLDENNLMLTCSEDHLFKFILLVAQHKISDTTPISPDAEVLAIAQWIKLSTRPIERGDRPIAFRKLRPILIKYGCILDHSGGGSNMKIMRTIAGGGFLKKAKVVTTNISYGGDGRDLHIATLNKLRSDLHLDEQHGIDSAAFYADLPFATDEFIVKYRKILNRLAKF